MDAFLLPIGKWMSAHAASSGRPTTAQYERKTIKPLGARGLIISLLGLLTSYFP